MNSLRRNTALGLVITFVLAVSAVGHPGSGILVDRLGQIYFIDTGSGLWKIDTKGAASHISPLRNHWIAIDPNDRFTQSKLPTDSGHDWVITAAGTNPTLLISTDFPLVIGPDGNLYYPSARERNARILKTTADGRTSTVVTLPRSVAGAPLEWINGLANGPSGSLYYTENNAVRRIGLDGNVTTIATVQPLAHGPKIPDTDQHPYLRGLKVDANGVTYVADTGDARVLKITADGKVSTLVQMESPWSPTDVAILGDVVYSLEYLHTPGDDRVTWMPRVRKITSDGKSTIIMTVDKMPGARPANATAMSYSLFSVEFFDLLVVSIVTEVFRI